MISKNLNLLIVALLAALGSSAMAAEPFSVESWGLSFQEAIKKNDVDQISKLLDFKILEKSAISCTDCETKEKLEKARDLFKKKQWSESLRLYNQIPKGTDYWFQAVEEKGWNYFQQNDSEKALAQSKTLLSPQFAEVVQTEAYFLQSLSQLKICDYKGVFATHSMFKEKQKSRILDIQKLADSGMNEAFAKVINNINRFPLQARDLSDSFLHLPNLYYKDIELQSQLLRFKLTEKALNSLKSQSNASIKVQNLLGKINQESFAKMKTRMATLAHQEADENRKIIQKLNLIEVEAIQRIHTDLALNKDLYSKGQFKDVQDDQLVFMDDGHPWIDELDKFEVAAKACPQNIRRKM